MSNRTIITLLNAATTASAAGSALCDYRFDQGSQNRTLALKFSGCEIAVYRYFGDVEHQDALVSVATTGYVSSTSTFVQVFEGPFSAIEVRKIGAGGSATAVAII